MFYEEFWKLERECSGNCMEVMRGIATTSAMKVKITFQKPLQFLSDATTQLRPLRLSLQELDLDPHRISHPKKTLQSLAPQLTCQDMITHIRPRCLLTVSKHYPYPDPS